MPSAVFLDLYRVLADPNLMGRHYRQRYAEIFRREFGVPLAKGTQIHDETFEWYMAEGARLDSFQGDMREGDEWVRAVQRMEADHLRMAFEMAGAAVSFFGLELSAVGFGIGLLTLPKPAKVGWMPVFMPLMGLIFAGAGIGVSVLSLIRFC